MPEEPPPSRAAVVARYAFATILGGSLLVMTYVLFDPDLGTEAPLFQEFTCRGQVQVTVTSGFFEPFLRMPSSGIHYRGLSNGQPVPSYTRIEIKADASTPWTQLQQRPDVSGEGFYFIPDVGATTQVRVSMASLDGSVCEGTSAPLAAREGPYEDSANATPS